MRRQTQRSYDLARADVMPRGLLVTLILFAVMVAFLGGASRYDAVQIIPLRTLSALFLIPAMLLMTKAGLKREPLLIWGFVSLTCLMAFQLVPLPPSIWHSLPMREPIVGMDAILGQTDQWRPLSLAPMRTWNALGSLVVPGAALFLAIGSQASSRALLTILGGVGVASAVLGLVQVLAGKTSPLYFYELSNDDSAIGFLANENHSAMFAACILLIIARLGIDGQSRGRGSIWPILSSAAFLLVFLTSLVIGSRSGFAASLGASLIAILMVWSARKAKSKSGSKGQGATLSMSGKAVLLLPLMVLALTVGAFIILGRAPAFQDLLANDSAQDMRWEILPVALVMLSKFWLFGAGFGSFEQAYKIFEPAELLMPLYVNQTHNDWLQILIEGGLVAGLLLAALLVWIARAIIRLARKTDATMLTVFWLSMFAIVGAASVIDYPLRTPLFQFFLVWLLVALSHDSRGAKDTSY